MTLTRERVEELRTWARHADTPMSDDFRGERLSPTALLALLDAWEELERIKAPMWVDASGIPRAWAPQWRQPLPHATETVVSGNPPPGWEHSRVPRPGEPGYFHAPLAAADDLHAQTRNFKRSSPCHAAADGRAARTRGVPKQCGLFESVRPVTPGSSPAPATEDQTGAWSHSSTGW